MRKKRWQFKTDNKLRGAFGETDYDKKIVRINKRRHAKNQPVRHLTKNKDGSENMLVTALHEINHVKHPKMGERGVEKLARAMKSRMSKKQKNRIYSKFR